ncbi:MAG: nitroreductase family protein [Promethearchaeota archaeon]
MAIIGINYEKCNMCGICISECPHIFRHDKEEDKIIFDDSQNQCNLCCRCICRCPKDAILYEDMGKILSFEEAQDPSVLISYETMFKFMSAKRSIRGFKKKKVPKEMIEKILNTMKYAPTGGNVRTLKCTIISDEDKIKKLSGIVMDELIASNMPGYAERFSIARKLGVDSIFFEAPHVMIIHSKNPAGDLMNSTIGLTYGMLAAQSLGLGTCWVGLAQGVFSSNKELRENILGIQGFIWGVSTLGYPTQKFYRIPPRPSIKTKGLEKLV